MASISQDLAAAIEREKPADEKTFAAAFVANWNPKPVLQLNASKTVTAEIQAFLEKNR